MSLSERIKLAMQKAGISQVELARACGVKPPSVHGWLSGKSKFLRGENLLQAAKALNVSESWLATGNGPMHPPQPDPESRAGWSEIRRQNLRIFVSHNHEIQANERIRGLLESSEEIDQELAHAIETNLGLEPMALDSLEVVPYMDRLMYERNKERKSLAEKRREQRGLPLVHSEKRQAPREQPEVHSPVMVFDPDDGVPDHVVLVPESRLEFSAGDGRINYEVVEDKEPVPYQRSFFQKQHINPDRVRRFPVTGDSMEPMLFGGDTILVNLDETDVIDGKVYALRYGDQLRVKFLTKRLDGTLILRSLNPAYKDEEIPAELANEHITIIGRVRDRSGTGGL